MSERPPLHHPAPPVAPVPAPDDEAVSPLWLRDDDELLLLDELEDWDADADDDDTDDLA